jgi:arylsulfatase A-like enzyme
MRILRTLAIAALCAGLLACEEPEIVERQASVGPNVLLITIDTLRADRIGSYGYRLPTSPAIDQLASRGVQFTDCTVQWPKTWPSMASMLTGAHPKTIGMKYRQRVLHPTLLLISELFRNAGYGTGAVVANFNVGKTFGFDQGFDTFVESWQEGWAAQPGGDTPFRNAPGKVKQYTNAGIVTDQALGWLKGIGKSRPFFLWLHYMDPHGPYLPPTGYEQYFGGAYDSVTAPEERLPDYQRQVDPENGQPITDLAHYLAQYDREIRYLDDEIGRLLREIDADDTLIVFTADHGESLGEHGYYLEHGMFPYQACARVPLIMVQEGRIPGGRVVDSPVGLIDLPATILDLAGIDIPATFEGESLVRSIEAGSMAGGPEYVFMEAGFHDLTQLVVRRGEWKLIAVRSPKDRQMMTGGSYELYDVISDPDELHNLVEERPDIVANLSKVLQDWFTGGARWEQRGEEIDLQTLSPEEQEMLKSLGYLR